jgi:hypothetical protein
MYDSSGDQIAHVKFTVLLLAGGTTKITGLEVSSHFLCTVISLCGIMFTVK